jgi:hypothetical protein
MRVFNEKRKDSFFLEVSGGAAGRKKKTRKVLCGGGAPLFFAVRGYDVHTGVQFPLLFETSIRFSVFKHTAMSKFFCEDTGPGLDSARKCTRLFPPFFRLGARGYAKL